MKRLQIYIEPEFDDALAVRAAKQGTSKAALIRRYVAERLEQDEVGREPLDALVGAYDRQSGSIDDVVYGR